MPLYSDKEFAKRMDASPRFPVVFVAILAIVVCVAGWGLVQCIGLFCNASGFAATILPVLGVVALAIILVIAQAHALLSAKIALVHVAGSADNFKKSYAALYAFSVAATVFQSWEPMSALWECAKICWLDGGFGYVLSSVWFLMSASGIIMAVCGAFGAPIMALAVLFDVPRTIRKNENVEVGHD